MSNEELNQMRKFAGLKPLTESIKAVDAYKDVAAAGGGNFSKGLNNPKSDAGAKYNNVLKNENTAVYGAQFAANVKKDLSKLGIVIKDEEEYDGVLFIVFKNKADADKADKFSRGIDTSGKTRPRLKNKAKWTYKIGDKVTLKADKKEGWEEEKVTIIGYDSDGSEELYLVEPEGQEGEMMGGIGLNQIKK